METFFQDRRSCPRQEALFTRVNSRNSWEVGLSAEISCARYLEPGALSVDPAAVRDAERQVVSSHGVMSLLDLSHVFPDGAFRRHLWVVPRVYLPLHLALRISLFLSFTFVVFLTPTPVFFRSIAGLIFSHVCPVEVSLLGRGQQSELLRFLPSCCASTAVVGCVSSVHLGAGGLSEGSLNSITL